MQVARDELDEEVGRLDSLVLLAAAHFEKDGQSCCSILTGHATESKAHLRSISLCT